jgi:hypothetical protein
MVVSHRPEHKVSGELHKGSNFSRPYLYQGKPTVHTRCLLSNLSVADIEAEDVIVDPAVRDAIRVKLMELGGDPKVFDNPAHTPVLRTSNGRLIPIRKVRIRETKNPLKVGHGMSERFVDSGGIHHVSLFVVRNENRKEIWESAFVQITEAYDRRRKKLPVVSRELQNASDAEFLFSLQKDDTVELDFNGGRTLARVKKFFATGQIWFTDVNNAQMDAEQKKQKTTWSKRANSLKDMNPRKVVVDLLGRVHPAND